MDEQEMNEHMVMFCSRRSITIEQEVELREAIRKIVPDAKFLMFEEAKE